MKYGKWEIGDRVYAPRSFMRATVVEVLPEMTPPWLKVKWDTGTLSIQDPKYLMRWDEKERVTIRVHPDGTPVERDYGYERLA